MFQLGRELVGEWRSPHGFAAAAGARRVAGLNHEVGDYAVEGDGVVVGARDERGEVEAGFGRVGGVEFEGYEAHAGF